MDTTPLVRGNVTKKHPQITQITQISETGRSRKDETLLLDRAPRLLLAPAYCLF